jgi:hypothetical protein
MESTGTLASSQSCAIGAASLRGYTETLARNFQQRPTRLCQFGSKDLLFAVASIASPADQGSNEWFGRGESRQRGHTGVQKLASVHR